MGLPLRLDVGGDAGVVGGGADALDLQKFRNFLGLFPREAIDDAAGVALPLDVGQNLFLLAPARHHAVVDVGPVKTEDKLPRTAEVQLIDDVLFGPGIGGGGKGHDRRIRQEFTEPVELRVLRSEIVPPRADAMRFVDGHAPRLGYNHFKNSNSFAAKRSGATRI